MLKYNNVNVQFKIDEIDAAISKLKIIVTNSERKLSNEIGQRLSFI